jgi:hypothetical protein
MYDLPTETVCMEPLHSLVDRVTTNFLPAADRHYNYFINEIPRDLSIEYNLQWVASVINGMISSAIGSIKNTCIRISARKFGHVLVLELREAGRANPTTDGAQLKEIQSLAEKIGGCLYVGVPEEERIMMSFSFPNLPAAA